MKRVYSLFPLTLLPRRLPLSRCPARGELAPITPAGGAADGSRQRFTTSLTRAAAACLAALMGGAVATHMSRREPAAVATALAALTIVVAMFR